VLLGKRLSLCSWVGKILKVLLGKEDSFSTAGNKDFVLLLSNEDRFGAADQERFLGCNIRLVFQVKKDYFSASNCG
jgi:hypothetical protein